MSKNKSTIFNSATKLVLLYTIFILGILTLAAGIRDILTGEYTEITKAILALFGGVISYVMGYYFGSKGETGAAADGK